MDRLDRNRAKPGGFTLIELLVTVAIIATVMAILLVALAQIRGRGDAVVCASNVRNLITAATAYAVDQSNYFPPAHIDFSTTNLHRWHGTRESTSQPFDFDGSPLRDYLQTPQITECAVFDPFDSGEVGQWGMRFEESAGGYGYNARLGSRPGNENRPVRLSEVRAPGRTLAFSDTAFARSATGDDPDNTVVIEYSFMAAPHIVFPDGRKHPAVPSIHFRHDDRANVARVDGSVRAEAFEWTYPPHDFYKGDNEAVRIGWFGPRDNTLFDP